MKAMQDQVHNSTAETNPFFRWLHFAVCGWFYCGRTEYIGLYTVHSMHFCQFYLKQNRCWFTVLLCFRRIHPFISFDVFIIFQMALSAAAPIYRGYLADIDTRWQVIAGSVDDRTREERGLEPLKKNKWVLVLKVNKERLHDVYWITIHTLQEWTKAYLVLLNKFLCPDRGQKRL